MVKFDFHGFGFYIFASIKTYTMRFIVFLLLLVTFHFVYSQENTHEIFRNLKNGAILVRLPNNTITIKAIEERNLLLQKKAEGIDKINHNKEYQKLLKTIDSNIKLLNKIVAEREYKHKIIIESFSNNFSFCPVYYFYSNDSREIKNKNFKGHIFNANKEFIDTINLSDNYLIAEFGETNEDTAKIKLRKTKSYDFYGHPNERLERNDETGYIEYVDYYYSSTGMEGGVDALVLLSPEFIQIQRPYPHYVRTFERLPFINRSYEETVLRLQHKIVKYTLEGVLF